MGFFVVVVLLACNVKPFANLSDKPFIGFSYSAVLGYKVDRCLLKNLPINQ